MKPIRFILGKIILFLDFVFSPTGVKRLDDRQDEIDTETSHLILYELKTCPFCVKVRRTLKRLSLKVELRDIYQPQYHQELMAGGKIDQVPCLRIEKPDGSVQWMYESNDINDYLNQRYSTSL